MTDRSSTGTSTGDPADPPVADSGEVAVVIADQPPQALEVRRSAGLAAGLGAVASAVALAYLARALGSGSVLDWTLFVLLGAVAATYLVAFADARTPLLVADPQGVRLRLGRSWCGMPWQELREIEHTPRRRWRDGRLVLLPHDLPGELAGLDAQGRRQTWFAKHLHGDPFAVPLSLSTRVVGADGDLTAALLRLSGGATTVVEVDPSLPEAEEDQVTDAPEVSYSGSDGGLDWAPERDRVEPARPRSGATPPDQSGPTGAPTTGPTAAPSTGPTAASGPAASPTLSPLRESVSGVRTEGTREVSYGATALHLRDPAQDTVSIVLPELGELRRDGSSFGSLESGPGVLPIATPGDRVEPIVFDDLEAEAAPDPVIGPELAAARIRLGLSVDQLADRTRIRPHVIESVEVDDFAPCGGDFYARGHLRTLARVVGIEVAPLLAAYDQRYADAPISPRRVFEAELGTGSHGSIRGTRGGPNWSVLIAAVMALVLAWSIARLVTDGPVDLDRAPSLNGSGGPNNVTQLGDPVPVSLSAPGGGATVVVKDGSGKTVFTGDLPFGATKLLSGVVPPIRVSSSDGSATVAVDGADPKAMGETGQDAQQTYVVR